MESAETGVNSHDFPLLLGELPLQPRVAAPARFQLAAAVGRLHRVLKHDDVDSAIARTHWLQGFFYGPGQKGNLQHKISACLWATVRKGSEIQSAAVSQTHLLGPRPLTALGVCENFATLPKNP